MSKKEIRQQEVLKRKEERIKEKQIRDQKEAERKLAWKRQQEIWAQKRKEREEKRKAEDSHRQLVVQRKHEAVFDDIVHLLETKIPKNILRGDSNRLINESLFFEIRNASFALTSAKKYSFNIPSQGQVVEHVNGRTNVGVYCAWLVLTNKINNWEDLYHFLLRFGCWIETTKSFNNHIQKYQNQSGGAIAPEIYMREYESYFGYKFSEKERTEFSKRFLFTEYGVITKDMIVNKIREKIKK